jgi:hypothetical protein
VKGKKWEKTIMWELIFTTMECPYGGILCSHEKNVQNYIQVIKGEK